MTTLGTSPAVPPRSSLRKVLKINSIDILATAMNGQRDGWMGGKDEEMMSLRSQRIGGPTLSLICKFFGFSLFWTLARVTSSQDHLHITNFFQYFLLVFNFG